MNEQISLSITKVSKTLELPGYILVGNIIQKVDEIAKQAVNNQENSKVSSTAYWITSKTDEMLKFETIDKFLNHVNSENIDFLSISLQYVILGEAGISVEFTHKGKIELSAYSDAPDFQFNIDRLIREIKKGEQEYNGFIKRFVLKGDLPRLLMTLVFSFSWLLLSSIGYYFYAQQVGVNIDSSLIPNGNEYARQVEQAIKSNDVLEKLDVLLLAQLRGFSNVDNVLQRQQNMSAVFLVLLAITTGLYFLSRFIVKLYPLTFFEFEPQKKALSEIYRKRDIVWVGVVIGFVVNVIAGLVIALID